MKRALILAAAAVLMVFNITLAQETAEAPKTETVSKTVTGIVSGISYNFIAVMFGQDEKGEVAQEMAFNVDKSVKIEHKSDIGSIKAGDTVSVAYEETTQTSKDGVKTSKRMAKAITFLRPAQVKPEGAENGSLESSGNSADMPLPIKGMKKGD